MTGILLQLLAVSVASFVLAMVFTPIVREFHRKIGMVDKPDPRRINRVPIPRGGGVGLFAAVALAYSGYLLWWCEGAAGDVFNANCWRMLTLAAAITALGLVDDRWSLSPRLKLFGQLVIAFAVPMWCDFRLGPTLGGLPVWLDYAVTTFWILGAVNAFNLIDGLDGLASGLAFIAVLGMAGAQLITGHAENLGFHFALAGGLIGFLRYNYNPATVFLGDSGSMFIGFVLACLPLATRATGSFMVSLGIPLLAMGVPIFDTALAILRRTIRRLLNRGENAPEGKVMTADSDHIHHRILRAVGFSQRKAAWILYSFALFLVALGLVTVTLRSNRTGLWLFALTVITAVIFRDMSRIEFFDTGRLLNGLAHDPNVTISQRLRKLTVPALIALDLAIITGSYFFIQWMLGEDVVNRAMPVEIMLRLLATFVALMFFRAYRTIWSRAMISNYLRLFVACCLGSVGGAIALNCLPGYDVGSLPLSLVLFAVVPFVGMLFARTLRQICRDFFYALDCSRLVGRKDVSRVLVYGAGLRYRSFRRELVRSAASNDRIIVGILDDDVLLREQFIGGIQVMGSIDEAPEIINRVNVDAVVIACVLDADRLARVRAVLRPTGVKVTHFMFTEKEVK